MLLGLMCELITRIPDICDLDDFMEGIISSTETHQNSGGLLSETKWYQFFGSKKLQKL